ncbi:glutathione S-transferase family protein [Burkholderia sp. D-99]|uniref:glutathione S-transferase N-terminal domain-containing protein n=1 Tax=Burkholderia sp. D-99 TaxID=2717316 RepID=UPI00141FD618|nr:glutathione S-transferase family protein [Burkholderia sp. D-99]
MITLYQFASSPLCEKVRRILAFKRVDYRIHEVDRTKTHELRQVSPFGKFPALDDHGTAVCDSTDIAHHLEARFPERPLIPADPVQAATVHIIEDWADESLYFYEITMRLAWEHNARRTVPSLMATLPAALTQEQALELVLDGARRLVAAQGLGRKTPEQIVADVRRHLKAVAALLDHGKFLVGNALTLADIAVLAQLNCLLYAQEVRDAIESFPQIAAWAARVDTLASATAPV